MPTIRIDRPFDHTERVRRANYLLSCKRCIGGTVLPFRDGRKCINCGAEHDENGELLEPRFEQPERKSRAHYIK